MQERIAEYVAMLKAKEIKVISDYDTPARVCAEYFDGRGIDIPNDSDWEAFKEYFKEKYRREKGKDISPLTLEKNYVARGKAFYKWCANQDGNEQTALLFEEDKTEASRPPASDDMPCPTENDANMAERETAPHKSTEPGKTLRVNFLINEDMHSALMSLAYLKGQTLTAILTEATESYIHRYSEEIATLEETRRKLRSK